MKIIHHSFLFLAALSSLLTINSQISTVFAQGTAFIYQGQLQNNGSPATGVYDLRFAVYDMANGGTQVGFAVTNAAIGVSNGLFTVLIDFGPDVFAGRTNWLEIGVATNGVNSFTTLWPRQNLTPVPYAVYAERSSAAGLCGTLADAQLPATVITNGSTNVNLIGNFSGNGKSLSGISAVTATVATNSLDGVRIIRANGGTNYFGNAPGALTNAITQSLPGDTVLIGAGIYDGDPTRPALRWPVNIIGSGPGTWDENARQFNGGTIITNGGWAFAAGYSNSVLANLSFESALNYVITFSGTNTYLFNASIRNVSYGQTVDHLNAEPIYLSGANLTIDNFAAYDLRMGHGFIIKGCSNFVANRVYLKNCGGNGLPSVFLEGNTLSNGNGNNNHIRLSDFTIDNGTNNCNPIVIASSTASINDDIDISGFVITSLQPNKLYAYVITLSCQGTDSVVSNVRINNVLADESVASGLFEINSYPGGGTFTNNYASDCELFSAVQPSYPCVNFWYSTNLNCLTYNNIGVNGKSYYGHDDVFLPGKPGANFKSALNVVGGATFDFITTRDSGTTNLASLTQAGHTNVLSASSVVIQLKHAFPSTNYSPNFIGDGASGPLRTPYVSNKTTTNFTARFSHYRGGIDWSAVYQTQ